MLVKRENAVELLVVLGFNPTAVNAMTDERLAWKLNNLPEKVREVTSPSMVALLDDITIAINEKEKVTVAKAKPPVEEDEDDVTDSELEETDEEVDEDDSELEEEEDDPPVKKPAKKATVRKPAVVEEDEHDSDEESEDDDPDDDFETESDDDEEEESYDEDEDDDVEATVPAKKASAKKPAQQSKTPSKNGKTPAKKGAPAKAGGEGKPGVIASIEEFLRSAGAVNKQLPKEKIGEMLKKRFPERSLEQLMGTVKQQVPGKLRKEKELNVQKGENGYFIPAKKSKK